VALPLLCGIGIVAVAASFAWARVTSSGSPVPTARAPLTVCQLPGSPDLSALLGALVAGGIPGQSLSTFTCTWSAPGNASRTVSLVVDRSGAWTYPGVGAQIVPGIGQDAYFVPAPATELRVLMHPSFRVVFDGSLPPNTTEAMARQDLEIVASQVAESVLRWQCQLSGTSPCASS
jgi:hypothetical protein